MTAEVFKTDAASGRFYTSSVVSDILVASMSSRPKRVIDLGSGAGSLASAALRRWRSAEIVTVDIDRNATPRLPAINGGRQHVHVIADVLNADLPGLLPSAGLPFDAAICNPPYILPQWKPSFERIISEAKLNSALKIGPAVGADVLFLAQNLRLTKVGGSLGLIVPDGIVTGRRLLSLRQEIMSEHCIESVVQLPRYCFKATDAQAFILILTKGRRQNPTIALRKLGNDRIITEALMIDADQAVERCDYAHHAISRPSKRKSFTLKDAQAHIVRGSLHSGQSKLSRLPCLHTTDLPCDGGRRLHFARRRQRLEDAKLTIAKCGDILVARIGRKLHLQVAMIASGSIAITDCIFRVRVESRWRERVFKALISRRGAAALDAAARGVGPRLMTKDDLLRMKLFSS